MSSGISSPTRRALLLPIGGALFLATVISWASARVETDDPSHTTGSGPVTIVEGIRDKKVLSVIRGDGQVQDAIAVAPVSPLATAVKGIQQELESLEKEKPSRFPRSNSARDTLFSFNPNMLDGSDENLARIEMHALGGSDDALAAFLLVAAHYPDYKERSHRALYVNAARGSTLALTTLSERATIGYGFAQPDRETSLFFEYLAWSTGQWSHNPDEDAYRPSIASGWTEVECRRATKMGYVVASTNEPFNDRDLSSPPRCTRDN